MEDTGETELSRLLYCLKENGYEYESVNKSDTWYGYMDATFVKPIKFVGNDGNYINDSHINVKIEFDNRFDYKNIEQDEEGDYIHDKTNAENFIKALYNNLLTTNERIGVESIVKAKFLPNEIGRNILTHVGTVPKGGKNNRQKRSTLRKRIKSRKIKGRKSTNTKKIKRKQYIKIKGGNGDKVNCCVCGKETNINESLIPGACSRIYGSKAHRMCPECWWNPENGFARENSSHACPGCEKGLPLPKISQKQTTEKQVVFDLTEEEDI